MQNSNQKKTIFSKDSLGNPQIFPTDEFQGLKSEFFETFQKNDLKLLSNGIFIFEHFN